MADDEINFQCKNGQNVTIAIDDVNYRVTVYDANRQEIGAL